MTIIIIKIINFYQTYLSFDRGFLKIFAPGGACKFGITCSEYTKQAIVKNGILKGSYLGAKRILNCR